MLQDVLINSKANTQNSRNKFLRILNIFKKPRHCRGFFCGLKSENVVFIAILNVLTITDIVVLVALVRHVKKKTTYK
jgi:hypothetical protein